MQHGLSLGLHGHREQGGFLANATECPGTRTAGRGLSGWERTGGALQKDLSCWGTWTTKGQVGAKRPSFPIAPMGSEQTTGAQGKGLGSWQGALRRGLPVCRGCPKGVRTKRPGREGATFFHPPLFFCSPHVMQEGRETLQCSCRGENRPLMPASHETSFQSTWGGSFPFTS